MATSLLDTLELPGADGPIRWEELSPEQLNDVARGALQLLAHQEPEAPTDGVLTRSTLLESTLREASALQYQYTGLLQDAFEDPGLRHCLDLPEGKTAFRDTTDLLAKTHGIRAYEASARLRIAKSMTPARASDPERTTDIGDTRLPLLGALRGQVNPSKLSTALSMIDTIEEHAELAGKDEAFRESLRQVIEKDLVEKIHHTTPEEFSRYVGQRKKDLLATIDPPDQNFTQRHTDAMYDVARVGPVRGNPNAIEYRCIFDAEGDESLQTLLNGATNIRGKDEDDPEFETRSRGHRRMHAMRDAIKFVLANFDKTGFRGASGAHTQLLVVTDYTTLLEGLEREIAGLLPELQAAQRHRLLELLAAEHMTDTGDSPSSTNGTGCTEGTAQVESRYLPDLQTPYDPVATDGPAAVPTSQQRLEVGQHTIPLPPPKTTDLAAILNDENLDRLQPRISRGIYSSYIPPDVILRMRCDVGVTPITLTGQRQVLSVAQEQRQFSTAMRRAILARDRGCAVPGCHIAASMCEIHHADPWAKDGKTSTDNGVMLCSHHHSAIHANALHLTRVDGEFRFVLHKLIDPTQQPRKNYFFQT